MAIMTTLYVRDVPEEVAAVLKERAAAAGQSLSAYVNAQLGLLAARPTNADVVRRLRERERPGGATTSQILGIKQADRR